jgi:hypothetical protein
MDINAIHQALADSVADITDLQGYPSLTGKIDPPAFAPYEFEMDYNKAFRPGSLTAFVLTAGVFVGQGDTDTGRELLTSYLDPTSGTSIKAAVEADRTLGGTVKTVNVDRAYGVFRLYAIGGVDYLGALLDMRIWA